MKVSNPISIMTFVFRPAIETGQIKLEYLFDTLKRIGFDGVEVFQTDIDETESTKETYRNLLDSCELKLSCIDILCDFISTDEGIRKSAVKKLHDGLHLAHEFQCEQVLVAGSLAKEEITASESRKMIAECISSQLEAARKLGVTMMLENFGMAPQIQCKADDCIDIIRQIGSDEIKFVFDTGNFVFAGEDSLTNLQKLYPYTRHVHIKSWRRIEDRHPEDTGEFDGFIGCPIDQGVVANGKLISDLHNRGYSRWYSLECGALQDPMNAAERDFKAFRKWLT
jgi:sugar phosphate isomerase/epimerase